MRTEQLGDGTPDVAVVGAIHGDEPCGVRAIERLLDENPPVDRPVKLVVANERAHRRGVRYTDEDLNRAFPGDPDAESYERRLAHDLLAELSGCTVFSLHSTQSYDRPFAILIDSESKTEAAICRRLSVDAVVEAGAFTEGRLIAHHAPTVEVECGIQHSEAAADNAYRLTREFLAAVDAVPLPADRSDPDTPADGVPVYRLRRLVPKGPAETYEVFSRNFEPVDPGEPFAAADGATLTADEGFVPVLMSPHGYEDIFGYEAEFVGRLD